MLPKLLYVRITIFDDMIHYTKGNLLDSSAEALVNTVNTVGVMGKGIALQFKERFPMNYALYHSACKAGNVKIGEMFVTNDQSFTGHKIIINFPTKTTWRRPSEYSYIQQGLIGLRKVIESMKIKSIAIPPLGSHNGGLDWLRVQDMMEKSLANLDCEIYIYQPSEHIIERLKSERVKLTPARAMTLDVLSDLVAFGEFISVFATEKIIYFLQKFGANDVFKIEYIPYYYGPYSKGKVGHLLYALNGSYIKGMGGMEVKPFDQLWMLPDTEASVKEYFDNPENENYKDVSNRTKMFLRGYYSAYSLELLSSVDYLLNTDKRLSGWKDREIGEVINVINEDLQKWSRRKDKLFNGSPFMPKIIDHLKECNTIVKG